SVAGVAIAVALVPPLGTVGIGVALGEWPLATGAAILFGTNFAAIGAAATVVFLLMGFKPEAGRPGRRAIFARGAVVLLAFVGVVAVTIVAWSRVSDLRFERQVETAAIAAVRSVDPDADLIGLDVDRRGNVLDIALQVH